MDERERQRRRENRRPVLRTVFEAKIFARREIKGGFTTQYLATKEEQREMFDFMERLSPNVSIDDAGVITELK